MFLVLCGCLCSVSLPHCVVGLSVDVALLVIQTKYRVKSGRSGWSAKLGQRPCLFHISSIPDKKRNTPLRTVQLSGKSQVIDQFSLYQCKGMSGTAASHIFCNQVSKLC